MHASLDSPGSPTASAPANVILGLDLGQSKDWTALTVTEAVPMDSATRWRVRTLDRFHPLRYQDVVGRVARAVDALREPVQVGFEMHRRDVTLVLDRTGVGRAVGDLFSEADLDCRLELVSIHGGDAVTQDPDGGWRVPKRDLAGVVAVVLQAGRLDIANRLELAEELRGELQNFRAYISASGHDSYGAGDDWREGSHDDLVLALALSLWWGERRSGKGFEVIPDDVADMLAVLGC